MAVSLVSSQTISDGTFYRNKPFDISFSVVSSLLTDASLYFSNSTYGVLPYTSNINFTSPTGVNALGSIGTLRVDVLSSNPRFVSTVTPQIYNAVTGLCSDPSGNVFFLSANCNRMYRLDPSGTVSVYAGTGTAGGTDGDRLTTAQFSAPGGLATDGSGTFYITDAYRLRKISPAGMVTTLAGNGTQGYVDGSGSVARFTVPGACVIDPCGDILISEADLHIIRKVKPNGDTSTYAGVLGTQGYVDGPLTTATFQLGPYLVGAGQGSWVFSSGFPEAGWQWGQSLPTDQPDFYAIAATSNKVLYGGIAAPSDGGPVWYASTPNIASLTSATGIDLDGVLGLAYNGSNLYVAGGFKTGSNRPLYYSSDGETWTAPVSPGSNVLSICASVAYGNGLWIACGRGSNDGFADASENFLTSTDGSNWTRRFGSGSNRIPARIRRAAYGNGRWVLAGDFAGSNLMVSTDGAVTWTTVANPMPGIDLMAVAYGNGTWVLGGNKVGNPVYTSPDAVTWTVASGLSVMPYICNVYYSPGSNLFVATGYAGAIALSYDGFTWGQGGGLPYTMNAVADTCLNKWIAPAGSARMYFPAGMVFDPSGTLYIADQYNNRIRTIVAGANTMTTFAGTGSDFTSNGTLTTAGIVRPAALVRDPSSGTLYIGSQERQTIQAITGNNVSLTAGVFFSAGYLDGPALSARFNGVSGLAVVGNNVYVGEVYNKDVRKITIFPEVQPGSIRPTGYTIVASSNYPIVMNSRIDVSWTSIGGSLPLYKYEPFCNTFTAKIAGDTLGYSPSSTELLGYLTGTGTANVAFRAPGGATTAYPYSLVLNVQARSASGDVVDDVSTSVTINPSRILVTPCNANLVFYRNEPISPVTFSLVSSPTSLLYSAASLPTGLTIVSNASNSSVLSGTPTTQTLLNKYIIVAQDTSGRTYSTEVTMIVNPERLVIDTSGSTTFGNVLSTTPVSPLTLTARFPPYNSYRSMRYTWSSQPPAGLQFRDSSGVAIPGSSYSVDSVRDASFSLTLSGTITEAQVRAYAKSNTRTVSTTVVGTRTFPVPSLSPSIPTTLTFTMGQVILFDSNVPSPFVGIQISNSAWWYSAKSYFGTDVSITNITLTDGFLPDGVTGAFTSNLQRFDLCGTPTTLASYGFTLTAVANGGALTASLPISVSTVRDVVTIFPSADTCSTYIQTRDVSSTKLGYYINPTYTASATSGCNTTLTASGLPDGVTLVSVGSNGYTLSGRPTTPVGLSSAVLTALVPASGVTATKTLVYSVSAERFIFTYDPSAALTFAQNVPTSPIDVIATTFSENPILRYSSGNLPPALTITNTGTIMGTPEGSADGSLTVDAYTAYATASVTTPYTITDDAVLLQPSVYTTVTAPGGNVSIPITGYSVSALTVSNYRFSNAFPYGLTINPITGLLSGTLSSSLPKDVSFTLLGSAGIVDGSLTGLMHTDNLTVTRAAMIENQDPGNLRVYFSDDAGVTWSNASSNNGVVAARVGANNIDTYLIPTSSDIVLRSTTGSNYTSVALGQSAYDPLMTGIAYKPGSSTWWTGGTLSNDGGRTVYVFKTDTDGLTWDAGTTAPGEFTDRSSNATPGPSVYDAYLYGGVDLAYRDGVLLLGGGTGVVRSVDDGASWTEVPSGLGEVGRFSLDQGLVWVAVGSDRYLSRNDNTYATDAVTIVYSLDQGLTWTPAASAFNMNAYEVLYASGAWLASGLDWTGTEFVGRIRYSFDGVNWPILTAIPSVTYTTTLDVRPPGMLGVIGYDQGAWKLLRATDDGGRTLYSHPGDTPLDSDWTTTDLALQFPDYGDTPARFSSYTVQTIDPGADVTTITFPPPTSGSFFISPVQSTYVVWQYMPLPPIQFSASSGIPIDAYFISALPVGLTWNGATQTVTGAPMRTGTQTFTVYAQNSLGVTAFTVTLLVEVPRIIKRQNGAGAYTSLVRQYTEVNAAQKARDTRALPSESRTLGEFASPYPPSVVTPSNCPC